MWVSFWKLFKTLTSVNCNGAEVPEALRSADISWLFLFEVIEEEQEWKLKKYYFMWDLKFS